MKDYCSVTGLTLPIVVRMARLLQLRRFMKVGAVIVGVWLVAMTACTGSGSADRITLGAPTQSQGISRAERLTDGKRAFEGNEWSSETAAIFRGPNAFAMFDLGEVTPIEAAYIQGDNNDRFVLEASMDGAEFTELWMAETASAPGLRGRWVRDLDRRARFIRLTAIGGDAWVSVSELQLFSSTPSTWPPRVPIHIEMRSSVWASLTLGTFALFAVLAVLVHRRGSRRWVSAALWTLAGMGALGAGYWVFQLWPLEASVIDVSRAVAASVACAVVLRLGLGAAHANTRVLTGLLAAMALLSVATFYNYGHPQFYDGAARRPTYVHTWDLRVYFPVAKYFDELGYDGVYLASVKAYADEELDGSLDSVKGVTLRDLRNYEMRKVSEVEAEIHAVKDRFSEERWAELKKDMSYFWKTMGPRAYLDSLRDHGGNATPAWLVVAHAIYASADAREATFLRAALLDPLFLLLFFVVAWRTFGLRPALVCIVAFGATTVYQFGSNWGGSTLRNDWMALLGLGVCALAARRYVLGGGLLAWSAMIRAFPALALLFLAAPIAWRLFERARRGQPSAAERPSAFAELLPLAKVGAGVVLVVVALGAWSTAELGWNESWGAWSQKISMHANKPNINHVGLTALVGHDRDNLWHNLRARGIDPEQWGPLTAKTMKDRRWLIVVGMIFFTLLALFACRGARLSDAAVVGTMMIPIYFYPSNYYLHILFVWPLLLAARQGPNGRGWSLVAATVLASCAIQWFGWLVQGRYGQFLFWSGVLLLTIVVLLTIAAVTGKRRRDLAAQTVGSERATPAITHQSQQVA